MSAHMRAGAIKPAGRNPGLGWLFQFHGAYNKRSDAEKKKAMRPGSFIRPVYYYNGMRFAVLTPIEGATPNPHRAPVIKLPKQCAKCGSRRNVEADHVDGDYTNNDPSNFQWLCRRDNAIKADRQAKAGTGRRRPRGLTKDSPKLGDKVKLVKTTLRKRGAEGLRVNTLYRVKNAKPPNMALIETASGQWRAQIGSATSRLEAQNVTEARNKARAFARAKGCSFSKITVKRRNNPSLTLRQAEQKADRLAKKNDRDYFVVREAGEYDVTDDEGLDTFYAGINQDSILYCSADSERNPSNDTIYKRYTITPLRSGGVTVHRDKVTILHHAPSIEKAKQEIDAIANPADELATMLRGAGYQVVEGAKEVKKAIAKFAHKKKNPDTAALYNAALAADKAWMNELVKTYGKKDAGTARFQKRGKATPKLKALHAAFTEAMNAWRHAAKTNKNPRPSAALTAKMKQWAKTHGVAELQTATLAARKQMKDSGIGTRVKAGKLQVVRIVQGKQKTTVTPLSGWLSNADATLFLKTLHAKENPSSKTNLDDPIWVKCALNYWKNTTPEKSGVTQKLINWNIAELTKAQERLNKQNPRPSIKTAKRLYKKFIGKPAAKLTRVLTSHPAAAGAPGGKLPVAKLAKLSYLKVKNAALKDGMIRFRGAERPALLSHPGGRQYYFSGGNQKLSGIPGVKPNPANCDARALARAGVGNASIKLIPLGEVTELGYFERKKVEDFRPVEYFHNLGEENGRRPTLCYDPVHQQMHLIGGDYRTLWNGINN